MNSFNTNAHDFRSKRKCISMTGCFIFVLLMSHASCRPSDTDDVPSYNDGDYTDADDIEWQNFPVAETTTKDHPIIYYKEDIVSEDYDPNKENKSSSTEHEVEIKPLPRRKYKNARRNRLNHTEKYRYIKPEKVYFDVYPIEDEDIQEDETKFNENDIHVEVISLLDDNNLDSNDNPELKHSLRKKSRKLSRRHRQRRDISSDIKPDSDDESQTHAVRHKRGYTYYKKTYPFYRGVFHTKVVIYPVQIGGGKSPVRGIYVNPGSPVDRPKIGVPEGFIPRIGDDNNTTTRRTVPVDEPPVWTSYDTSTQRTTTRRPTRRPAPPLIHSGDEDYVPQETAQSNIPSPQWTTTVRPPNRAEQDQRFPIYTRRPTTVVPWSRPRTTQRPRPRPTTTTTTPPPPPQESRGVSACIWAISACCTRTGNIRYQCFERLGCDGAFWDFNPCADDIYRRAVEAGNQFLD